MPRKFIYGPGLPGYGPAGTDGSTGLTGLAVFFSAYDGNSDTVTIKGKIIANKELFSNDILIPGYPTRTYQTGDIFIDKNARVFQIDFAEGNLYKDTGIFLNTSGFFTEGPPQTLSPGFQRYSNAFETDKFLIDVVYTNTVGDYTQYPVSMYDNGPAYFGRVSYIGDDILPDLNGWYPFEIWTISDNISGNDSIGLARRGDRNEWHFGNYDDGDIRDVSLYLDFNDIYCPSIAQKIGESQILFWNTETGRISYGASPSGMTLSNWGTSRIVTSTSETTINAESNLTFNGSLLGLTGDASITGNLKMAGSPSVIEFTGTGVQEIRTISKSASNSYTLKISSGTPLSSGPYSTGGLQLLAGDGADYAIGGNRGGDVSIYSGVGGDSSNVAGGLGGLIKIKSGNAGHCTGAVTADGAPGGSISILAGIGGNCGTSGTTTTGKGGDVSIGAGNGYADLTRYGGGNGGNIYLAGGKPGSASYPGKGGDIQIFAGPREDGVWDLGLYTGNILIGCTLGGSGRGRAFFNPGSASNPGISFGGASGTGNRSGFYFAEGYSKIGVSIDGVENFRFDASTFHAKGNIVAYTSIFSDIRLKENIEPIGSSLDKVLQLEGISYTRKSNGEKHIGYIAQEVEKVIPEVVLENTLPLETGDETTLYKTINYQELIPYLSEAIKEQNKKINMLEEKIESLINEINQLKK
jgi:hypothetical protein